jgi:hypothetical protein
VVVMWRVAVFFTAVMLVYALLIALFWWLL